MQCVLFVSLTCWFLLSLGVCLITVTFEIACLLLSFSSSSSVKCLLLCFFYNKRGLNLGPFLIALYPQL